MNLNIIGRTTALFSQDLLEFSEDIDSIVSNSRFLVIGGGDSIGQAVVKELFKRKAKALHVVDLNENYLAELVRDVRSGDGYLVDDFDTYALDCGAIEFEQFIQLGQYDYVLNLSAMKHVRSENSIFSMLRMVHTNIINTLCTYDWATKNGVKKYFCVSTDKAANPANFMGASKRAMELCLMRADNPIPVTGARFANVAFSNGSLLEGFGYRMQKKQPLSVPLDISRFFITPEEAGIICVFSAVLGEENDILFPYNEKEMKLTSFKTITENFLSKSGRQAIPCSSETEARDLMESVDLERFWPVNYFYSDTTGEKPFEEFYTNKEDVHFGKYTDLAVIKFVSEKTSDEVASFLNNISKLKVTDPACRQHMLKLFADFVPTFEHVETNKFLNSRM